MTPLFGLRMLWVPETRMKAIVDDCYEAATDASDYAGSISGGDSDNDQVGHNPVTAAIQERAGWAAFSYCGRTNKSMHVWSYFERVLVPGGRALPHHGR